MRRYARSRPYSTASWRYSAMVSQPTNGNVRDVDGVQRHLMHRERFAGTTVISIVPTNAGSHPAGVSLRLQLAMYV